jgi:hypothetical protein
MPEVSKDIQIDDLIAKAEKLVADLQETVRSMKVTLTAAAADIQGAKDVRSDDRRAR